MAIGLLGRMLAIAGIVTGLLAVGLPFGLDSRYVDDGTFAACLLVLLSFSSWLPAEIGRDLLGSAAGAAAFGLFLFVPSTAAFDRLGDLDAGAWLGLCTVLVPVGGLLVRAAQRPQNRPEPNRTSPRGGLGLPAAAVGLALVLAGIWLEAVKGGATYWNGASSGHAVGVVMLILVAANVAALGPVSVRFRPGLGDLGVLTAAATCGYVEAGLVTTAFEDFGSLGAGGWIEACGGAALLLGALSLRREAVGRAAAGAMEASPVSAG